MDSLQAVDIAPFLNNPSSEEGNAACQKVLSALKTTSCLIVRDPRVREEDNVAFLNLVESYFSQPRDDLLKDVHPELSYQLGATPEFTEVPRDHAEVINHLAPQHAAHLPKVIRHINQPSNSFRAQIQNGGSSGVLGRDPQAAPSQSSMRRQWCLLTFQTGRR